MYSAELDPLTLAGLRKAPPKGLKASLDRLHRFWGTLGRGQAETEACAQLQLTHLTRGGLPHDHALALIGEDCQDHLDGWLARHRCGVHDLNPCSSKFALQGPGHRGGDEICKPQRCERKAGRLTQCKTATAQPSGGQQDTRAGQSGPHHAPTGISGHIP